MRCSAAIESACRVQKNLIVFVSFECATINEKANQNRGHSAPRHH